MNRGVVGRVLMPKIECQYQCSFKPFSVVVYLAWGICTH
jgi:hypothetical protein